MRKARAAGTPNNGARMGIAISMGYGEEYKNVVLYVAENKLTQETMTDAQKEEAIKMAPTYMDIFGREVCDIFLQDVLEIPKYAEYFGVNLTDVK